MNIHHQAAKLAEGTEINPADILSFAQSIANSLVKDGVKSEQFKKHSSDLLPAYADAAVKKFNSFHTIYLTNQEARKAFQYKVLQEIKC